MNIKANNNQLQSIVSISVQLFRSVSDAYTLGNVRRKKILIVSRDISTVACNFQVLYNSKVINIVIIKYGDKRVKEVSILEKKHKKILTKPIWIKTWPLDDFPWCKLVNSCDNLSINFTFSSLASRFLLSLKFERSLTFQYFGTHLK